MIKPRFAVNVYAIGGVVFLIVGIGEIIASQMFPITAFVLLPMGILFTLIGVIWTVLAGRRGRLRAPRGLAESGTKTTATLVDVTATRSVSRAGEYGPVLSQVYRMDLEVHAPTGPYVVRIYRSLRGGQIVRAVQGATVPVAIDPDNKRKIAILWDQAAPFGAADGQQLGAAIAQAFGGQGGVHPYAHQVVSGVASAAPAFGAPQAAQPTTVAGQLRNVTPVGTSSSGTAALQVVVEVGQNRFAQGIVAGPSNGRTPQVGEAVNAQLDPTGNAVVAISW